MSGSRLGPGGNRNGGLRFPRISTYTMDEINEAVKASRLGLRVSSRELHRGLGSQQLSRYPACEPFFQLGLLSTPACIGISRRCVPVGEMSPG
jgi:hypothetical protein